MGGTFAAEGPDTASVFSRRPPAFGPVYYFPSEWARQSFPSERAKVYGLYRLEDAQWRWVLVSAEYHFQQVLVCGGTLYATVGMTEQVGGHTVYFNRVLRSKDLGKHWEDISHGLGRGAAGSGRFSASPSPRARLPDRQFKEDAYFRPRMTSYQWSEHAQWIGTIRTSARCSFGPNIL